MRLTLEISDETFEKLKKQARKAGVSIEAVAGGHLAQLVVNRPKADASALARWSKSGRPWNQLSLNEIQNCYRDAYKKKPADADEFAWHDEDVAMFEDRN